MQTDELFTRTLRLTNTYLFVGLLTLSVASFASGIACGVKVFGIKTYVSKFIVTSYVQPWHFLHRTLDQSKIFVILAVWLSLETAVDLSISGMFNNWVYPIGTGAKVPNYRSLLDLVSLAVSNWFPSVQHYHQTAITNINSDRYIWMATVTFPENLCFPRAVHQHLFDVSIDLTHFNASVVMVHSIRVPHQPILFQRKYSYPNSNNHWNVIVSDSFGYSTMSRRSERHSQPNWQREFISCVMKTIFKSLCRPRQACNLVYGRRSVLVSELITLTMKAWNHYLPCTETQPSQLTKKYQIASKYKPFYRICTMGAGLRAVFVT